MKNLTLSFVLLIGSLVFHACDSASETPVLDLTAEELDATGRAAEYARRGSKLHADGDFDGAERQYIESLRVLPLRSKTEQIRKSYQEQLTRVLEKRQVTPKEVEYRPNGDIEDKVPFFGFQHGTPAATKDLVLPKVEFSDVLLTEALAYLEAQSLEHASESPETRQGVTIHLAAPSAVANTPITLHLTNVPLSEAILRTAELASCRVYQFSGYQSVMISCVDLLPLVIEDPTFRLPAAAGKWHNNYFETKYSRSMAAAPVGKWYAAYEMLQMAGLAATEGNKPKARYYYGEALNLYTIISDQHTDFFPGMVRARIKDLAEILEGK